MVILRLSEVAINNDDFEYWNVDNRLNKHRTVEDFDVHVQKMLLALGSAGGLTASVSSVKENGYFFVEFNDVAQETCIRVLHTVNYRAKYMRKYFEMNCDLDNARFAYVQYELSKEKTKVEKVKAVVPDETGKKYICCDLSEQFLTIKQHLGAFNRDDIDSMLCQLREEVARIKSSVPEVIYLQE